MQHLVDQEYPTIFKEIQGRMYKKVPYSVKKEKI